MKIFLIFPREKSAWLEVFLPLGQGLKPQTQRSDTIWTRQTLSTGSPVFRHLLVKRVFYLELVSFKITNITCSYCKTCSCTCFLFLHWPTVINLWWLNWHGVSSFFFNLLGGGKHKFSIGKRFGTDVGPLQCQIFFKPLKVSEIPQNIKP